VNDLIREQSKCNDLQGQEQGLGNKAKDLTLMAKDLKIILKGSLRPRTPITGQKDQQYVKKLINFSSIYRECVY